MNIAFITPEYPLDAFKGNIGGIGTFTKSLGQQLVRFSCKVTVFVHSQPKEQVLVENGVEIHLVKKKAVKGITWYTNRRYFNQYVNTIISEKNIEVIEAPEWTGFTAFMKFSCPLVIRLHGSDTYFCDLENRKVKAKNKFFEKKAITGANKIVGVSGFVTQKTKQLFNLNIDIEVVYNAVNSSLFKPNHQEIKPKTLLYFGTIVRKKGVLSIAKVFNEIVKQDNEVKLCLLGRDNRDVFTGKSTLEMFKKLLSKKAKKQFTYVAAVPYEEVIQFIQQADIVLLPSFAEAFPMTWLEAMALEKKLVTSNIGWAKELMVDNETGFTVNPENIKEFSTKILALLQNETEAIQMARNARQRIVKEFDILKAIEKNIQLYKECIIK